MDWHLFASTFLLIFVAELPDKTAFASLLMATKNNPVAVFIGSALAFVIQSLVAIVFGSVLGFLPHAWVQGFSGVLFLVFAVMMWRQNQEAEADEKPAVKLGFFKTVTSAFVVIFVAEWGDLTQLATAALQAKYQAPVTLFLAATLALWTVSFLGVTVGHYAKNILNPLWLQKIAAVAFLGFGIYFIVTALVQA